MGEYVGAISKSGIWRVDLLILVSLGTQDKSFERLLKAIDKAANDGHIKDKIIVQAGFTKYSSSNMEVFDLIAKEEFERLLKECKILITHGGIGTILQGLKEGKKIIAASRLKEHGEHVNDHQVQIVQEFAKENYIIELDDFDKIGEIIKEINKTKFKKFKSSNSKMLNLLTDFMEL